MVLIVMSTFACSLFTRTQATPTPDPYIFPEVTIPLKIEPESLPNAQTGVEYEIEIRVSDNVTPVSSVFLSNVPLPAGLELVHFHSLCLMCRDHGRRADRRAGVDFL